MLDPRQRRRVQLRRESRRLLRAARPASPPRWSITRSAISSPSASARWASRRSTRRSSTTASAARTWPPSTATAATACARPVVFYNRCNEAAAQLKPGDFDWKAIFGGGVRWFHSGGIFAALSTTTPDLIIEAMKAAKAGGRGRVVRPELPREAVEDRGAAPSAQSKCSARSSSTSTCWSATKRTCRRAWASRARRSPPSRSSIPSAFFGMIEQRREAASRTSRSWPRRCARCTRPTATAGARSRGSTARRYVAPTCELDVYDRVGGGDGFASGLLLRPAHRRVAGGSASSSAGRTARC